MIHVEQKKLKTQGKKLGASNKSKQKSYKQAMMQAKTTTLKKRLPIKKQSKHRLLRDLLRFWVVF